MTDPWLLVVGCARAPAPAIANAGAGAAARTAAAERLVERSVNVGTDQATASRVTWELSIEGDRGTLVETDEEAPGSFTLGRADREARWATTRTHVEKGPVHQVGDHLALDLESASDSLFLRCWHRSIVVATAGAVRTPAPGQSGNCDDPGRWTPSATTRIDALVCGQGDALDDGQVAGIDGQQGSIDETLWRFAAAPGVEVIEENDGCFQSAGLRLAK